jgi:hypothetical protein
LWEMSAKGPLSVHLIIDECNWSDFGVLIDKGIAK